MRCSCCCFRRRLLSGEADDPSTPFVFVCCSRLGFVMSLLSVAEQLGPLFGPMQFVGYVACVFTFSAFFMATHRRYLMFAATGSFVWALHYHLLGERVASFISAIIGARSTVAARVVSLPRGMRAVLTLAVCTALLGLSALAWSGPLTVLPASAACLSTTASFWLIDRAFRRVLLVSESCWLLFGVLAGSIGCIAAASTSLLLNLWTLRRLARQINSSTSPAVA